MDADDTPVSGAEPPAPPAPTAYVPPPPPYGWPSTVLAPPTDLATEPATGMSTGISDRAQREHRKSSAIVAFVIATVVFITAFGLGHNGGLGGSSSSSSAPSAIVSSNDNGSTDTSGVSAKVSPAVVNINTTLSDGGEAAGTGIVLTADGTVLTNNHVIEGATDIQVEVGANGTMKPAKIIGYDAADDVAVIKIKNVSNLKTVTLGDSSRVSVGDTVIALGNALGKGGAPAVTSGVVSGLNKTITAGDANGGNSETLQNMIQIDAAIQPGDSGGPLVNTNGEVIGIDTAAATAGGFRQSTANVAFAIPINNAKAIAQQIIDGRAGTNIHIGERGIIGVSIQSDNVIGRRPGSTTTTAGAAVLGVEASSPADTAGLKSGDTIVGVGDTTVHSSTELNTAMSPYHPGDKVSISWLDSSGQKQTKTITLILGPPA